MNRRWNEKETGCRGPAEGTKKKAELNRARQTDFGKRHNEEKNARQNKNGEWPNTKTDDVKTTAAVNRVDTL